MPLIKGDQITEDPWVYADDEDELPSGDVVVHLERWEKDKDSLRSRNGKLGLILRSDQSPELVADDLAAFDLIALDFPAFKDGRAFSYARMLRERFAFEGEIRAVGDVHRDQLFFMHRCGFDAFEVENAAVLQDWLEAAREFTSVYQPALDAKQSVLRLRHHTKKAAE